MIKTQTEIDRYFYTVVKASNLGKAITGSVYRPDMRPDNPTTEDIIVGLLTGIGGQTQEGVVLVNVYVPDKPDKKGRLVADLTRIGVLQSHIQSLISDCQGGDYYIDRNTETPRAIEVKELHQHCFTIRLQFKTITD